VLKKAMRVSILPLAFSYLFGWSVPRINLVLSWSRSRAALENHTKAIIVSIFDRPCLEALWHMGPFQRVERSVRSKMPAQKGCGFNHEFRFSLSFFHSIRIFHKGISQIKKNNSELFKYCLAIHGKIVDGLKIASKGPKHILSRSVR
jgi:hypothetical protein